MTFFINFIIFILSILFFTVPVWLILKYLDSTPRGKARAAQRAEGMAQRAKEAETYTIENIISPLRENPDDVSYANLIPSLLESGRKYHPYNYGNIYNLALEILASNSDKIHIKTLCLTLGRTHYSNLRPDKKVTIYDEQAIQNDILMRSSR